MEPIWSNTFELNRLNGFELNDEYDEYDWSVCSRLNWTYRPNWIQQIKPFWWKQIKPIKSNTFGLNRLNWFELIRFNGWFQDCTVYTTSIQYNWFVLKQIWKQLPSILENWILQCATLLTIHFMSTVRSKHGADSLTWADIRRTVLYYPTVQIEMPPVRGD